MDWFDDPKVWMIIAALVAFAGLIIYFMSRKRSKPAPESPKPQVEDSEVTELDNEDFGMYESALAKWLETHSEDSQQIRDVSSVPPRTEYMESNRFHTPAPLANPPATSVDRQKYLLALYQEYRRNN